jgi:radical SAM superfamily enzyme YgiQ (UPF0313 family)
MKDLWENIEPVLPTVSRPGRYVGNELHCIKKDWNQTDVHFVLAFPDLYEIGMSNVGMEILYHVLNRCDWIAAERTYSPWIDMEKQMREKGIPLFSLESRRPVCDFDIVGITLQYELHYTNILNLIDLAGISLRSRHRKEQEPLVIAGGPCAFNPEPMTEFFDAVVLGDGEEIILEIADLIRQAKRESWQRAQILRTLSRIKGIYVPSLYEPEEDQEGRFFRIVPKYKDVPDTIEARVLESLEQTNYPDKPLVPLIEVTHDRYAMEIMRGCTRGCRFAMPGCCIDPYGNAVFQIWLPKPGQ